MTIDFKSFTDELMNISNVLKDYLQEVRRRNPSVSESALSKKMNIPVTTFNRLINGYSKPSTVTMLKLMQFIPELSASLPEEVAKVLKVTLQKKNSKYAGKDVEILLYDKNNFFCWVLASSDRGVTKEDIMYLLGYSGIKALDLLEKEGVLLKNKENYYQLTEPNKNIVLSLSLIKNHVISLMEQYNCNNIDNNYIHYLVNTLNEEGVRKVMKVHQETHRKVQEIMGDSRFAGDIPLFSLACSDLLADSTGGMQ